MADSIRDSIRIRIVTPDSIRYSIRMQTADSQVQNVIGCTGGGSVIKRSVYDHECVIAF